MNRYTAYVTWEFQTSDGGVDSAYDEEIDVDAADEVSARAQAAVILARDYIPGGRVARLAERHGLYL